ncbi:MAG: ABC transporter permease [Gammaproteobacteria bacterium]
MSARRCAKRRESHRVKLAANIQEGLLNLFSSKLRSVLALLGILVGTASVVAMVLGGELAANEAIKQFKTLGTDLMAVSVNEAAKEGDKKSSGTQENLTLAQAYGMTSAVKAVLDIAPYTQLYNPVQFNGNELNGSVLGVTENFARVVHIELEKGRFVSILDGYAFFCVIGHGLYQELKKYSFQDPIGQQIQVGKNVFTIIGIAKPWPENSFVYANIDSSVMVPLLTSTTLSKYSVINNIIARLSPDSDIDQVKTQMTNYLNKQVANKQLFFRSAKEFISHMTKQSEILTIFLGLIGSVSLIVGGIGVMNIMLVSVVERRREIGIRLAVGARKSDIRSLFLVEAVMLSLVGGTLGVVIGILIAYLIALFSNWQFMLFLLPPLIGFTVSVATGVFFGFYPAYKASQLNPIEALRSE